MTIDDVVNISNQALYLIIELSVPILLISLVVGLIISILQTITSIQEQTLTFVPKFICIFLALMLLGYWMLSTLKDYMIALWGNFAQYIR